MRAVQFRRFGPPEVLELSERPEPRAGSGQVRIRVRASGVSPVDLAVRAGRTPSRDAIVFPHVTGLDAAGVVDDVGEGVVGTALGDEVFGAVELSTLGGAAAELAVLSDWAPRPPGLTWEEAGAAGTGVETATRALDLLDVSAGATLLVDGAAGGVGTLVVQLARARGARVFGTARRESQDFVESLGAEPVVAGPNLADRLPPSVDLALDVAGSGTLPELVALTGRPDAVLTLSDFTARDNGVRISLGRMAGEPDGWHGLRDISGLVATGSFRVPIQHRFLFHEAAQAHAALESGPRRGKTVLTVE